MLWFHTTIQGLARLVLQSQSFGRVLRNARSSWETREAQKSEVAFGEREMFGK